LRAKLAIVDEVMSLGSPWVAPALEGVSAPGVDCLSADAFMCLAQFRAEPKPDRYAHGLIAQVESPCGNWHHGK